MRGGASSVIAEQYSRPGQRVWTVLGTLCPIMRRKTENNMDATIPPCASLTAPGPESTHTPPGTVCRNLPEALHR